MKESVPSTPKEDLEDLWIKCTFAFDLAREQKGRFLFSGGRSLSSVFLQEGDIVVVHAVKHEDEAWGFIYEVTKTGWSDLGINNHFPARSIYGRLQGAMVPKELLGRDLCLLGSKLPRLAGEKAGKKEDNVIVPGARLDLKGAPDQFQIDDYAIARRDTGGNIQIIEPKPK